MTTYVWKVVQLDTAPSDDGLTDVVKTAHYTVDAIDGDYQVGAYGSIGFDAPDPATFKPYSELTQDEIVGWVKDKLDVAEVEATLDAGIENKKNPPIVQKPLPWVA